MHWIKNLFQRFWGAKPSNSSNDPVSCPDVEVPTTNSNIEQYSTDREKELIKKVERMAKQEKTDPREYLALSPSYRVMLAVKKSEYHGPSKPETNNIPAHPRYLRKPSTSKPTPPSYSVHDIEQVWRQLPDVNKLAMSKKNCLKQNLDKKVCEPLPQVRDVSISCNKLAVAGRSLPVFKRSRPHPTQGKLLQVSKAQQNSSTKRDRGVKRPRAETANDNNCRAAKKPRCAEAPVKRRVFLTRPDPAKDEMRRIRDIHRTPQFIFRCGDVFDTYTCISQSTHCSSIDQCLDLRNNNNKRLRPESAEDGVYQVKKKRRCSPIKVVKNVRRSRPETAKEAVRSFANKRRIFRYVGKSILTQLRPGSIPDNSKSHPIG